MQHRENNVVGIVLMKNITSKKALYKRVLGQLILDCIFCGLEPDG